MKIKDVFHIEDKTIITFTEKLNPNIRVGNEYICDNELIKVESITTGTLDSIVIKGNQNVKKDNEINL